MADFGSLVTNLGFPIAMAVYLLYELRATNAKQLSLLERYRDDSIENAKLVEKATEVLNRTLPRS